jgi:hypothetical protein
MCECRYDVDTANHVGGIHKSKRFGGGELVKVEKANPR